MSTDEEGRRLRIRPKVVDAGHHHRRIMRLTGLDVEENQAQRMLNDLEEFRAINELEDLPSEEVAHQWLSEVYQPTIAYVPKDLRSRLAAPQLFHEILEHRWYLSQQLGLDVPTLEAVRSYVDGYLRARPDERIFLPEDTQEITRVEG